MPKSRISRIIALLALLAVALVLAMASGGENRDGIGNGGWGGDEPVIELGFHFGW